LPDAGASAVFRPTNIHGAVLDKIFLRSRFYDPWGFQSFTQFKTLLKSLNKKLFSVFLFENILFN